MNILITGGTGFIGSHLLHRLVFTKHKIFIIKRPSSDIWRIKDIQSKLSTININTINGLEEIFLENKIDIIVHLAMKYVKHHQTWKNVKDINETNITFPSILLDLARKYKVDAFINTGTCFEYKPINFSIDENSRIDPYNFYASTKVAFEDILKFFVRHRNIKGVTLKLFLPYGEMDNQKVIPSMIKSLINNTPIELTPGAQKLNFTYVGDIVDAYIKTLEFVENGNLKSYEVFNIGTDKTYTLKQVAKNLENISGKKNIISFSRPYPPDEIMYMSCNFKKASQTLNWYPKTDIIDGLTRTYKHYLEKPQ